MIFADYYTKEVSIEIYDLAYEVGENINDIFNYDFDNLKVSDIKYIVLDHLIDTYIM